MGLATAGRVGDPCGPGGRRLAAPQRGARQQGRARVRVAVAADGNGGRRGRGSARAAGALAAVPAFRRSCTDPDDWTAYRVHAPRNTDLDTVVRVAGTRWCIESGFEAAKQETGLDEYEVRSATGWYRNMTLALLRATMEPRIILKNHNSIVQITQSATPILKVELSTLRFTKTSGSGSNNPDRHSL